MGCCCCCCGTSNVEPTFGDVSKKHVYSRETMPTICKPCNIDGEIKMASWNCKVCKENICNSCARDHSKSKETRSHVLIPLTAPREQETKHAHLIYNLDTRSELHYVDTLGEDHWNQVDGPEQERGTCLLPVVTGICWPKRLITQSNAIVTASTFVPGGYIAVADYLNEQVRLFDYSFYCNSYTKLEGYNPCDICNHGRDVYVATENKCKIFVLYVSLPLTCLGRKLFKKGSIKTEGYCDSIAVCKRSSLFHGLVVGMTFSPTMRTKRYQVSIMTFKGQVLKVLYNDERGQTLFSGKLFVSGSPMKGEVYVSDKEGGTIQGFNTITGEGLFKHKIQEPLGITVDKYNTIYIVSNFCFYYIPPDRENAIILLKRGHRSKSYNCSYDNRTKTLAVTSSHSETIQFYRIETSVTSEQLSS